MSDAQPQSHVPYGQDGTGHYSQHNFGAHVRTVAGKEMILQSLNKVDSNCKQRFMICDYGTADGGVSMPLMKEMIQMLHAKYGKQLPIEIIYEDQPVNDFKSVFLRVHNLLPGSEPSYFKSDCHIFVYCCGTTFYQQCVPSSSLSFGTALIAINWLSEKPCDLQNDIVCWGSGTTNSEKECFMRYALHDWETFLLMRANELKPGGRLVVSSLSYTHKEEFGEFEQRISVYAVLRDTWKQMVNEGLITANEFLHTTFALYSLTIEELSAPFNNKKSAISNVGLKLCECDRKLIECQLREKWKHEPNPADPERRKRFAETYIKSTREWSNSVFYSALSSERSEQEKRTLVDELYSKCESLVAENPDIYGLDHSVIYLDIEKASN